MVERLSDDFRCVNVDLPGHGGSPRTGAYDVFSQAEAVARSSPTRGSNARSSSATPTAPSSPPWSGASAPVRGVVNVDQELDTAAFAGRMAPLEPRLRGGDFEAAFGEFVDTLGPDLVPGERRAGTRCARIARSSSTSGAPCSTRPLQTSSPWWNRCWPAYPVPYLALYGAAVSAEERRLLDLMPQVEVEEWEGLGHFVHLVDPDRIAARIRRFATER